MRNPIDLALKRYAQANYIIRLKARFIFVLGLIILVLYPVAMVYTGSINLVSPLYGYVNLRVILPEFIGFILVAVSLILLMRGYFSVAAHMIFIVALVSVWTVMALDRSFPVSRLDSIALILGLSCMSPLIILRRKQAIILYSALNIVLLIGFIYFFRYQFDIPDASIMDYLADNIMTITFIGIVGYNVFSINQRALERAEEDIQARWRAEEELAVKNALLQAQAEASLDGILFVNGDGRIISYNRRFVELWHIPSEIVATQSDEMTIKAVLGQLRDPEEFICRVEELYAQRGEVSRDEIVLVDGRTFDRYSEPVQGPAGEYLGRVWFFRDITTRLHDEERLRASEERYRAVVEDQNEMIARFTPEGVITFVNSAYRRYYHSRLAIGGDFVGKNIREIMQTKNIDAVQSYLAALTLEKPTAEMERSFIGRDGEIHWTVWNTRALFHEAGQVEEYQTVGRDITEKKKAEAALRESTELYHQVISSIPSIFWKTDLEPQMRFTNTYISDAVDMLLGLPHGSINNDMDAFLASVHPDDLPLIMQTFGEALQKMNEKVFCEYRIRRPDGEMRWFYTSGASRINDKGMVQVFGVTEDITERKAGEQERNKLEEQLRQSQKMESIGRLAGGIAHDFNNLLTAITGNIQLALMDLEQNKPPQIRLKEAAKASDSAAALTRQLLAFSRKQIIEPKIINLNLLIEQMSKLLIRVIGEDVVLQTMPHETIGMIKADPGQIEQILVNLAVNARDAMPGGGKLTIETADVVLDEFYCQHHANAKPGKYVLLAMSDSGVGMDAEVQQHLFEPFFTTKPKGKGTGLGLATIYGAVMQNGGSIEVYSAPGQGTTFKLYFPWVRGEAALESQTGSGMDLPQGKETILLVEDESQVLDFAQDILTRLGYTVIACASAEEALALQTQQVSSAALLMTDVILPGMNGRDLAAQITARHPHIKVLYASGYTENVIVHHGVLDEGIRFIGKPYTTHTLAWKIREVLDAASAS